MKKYDPATVMVSITIPYYETCYLTLAEIYSIQNAAKHALQRALDGAYAQSSSGICYKIFTMSNVKYSTAIIRMVGQIATRWPHSASPGRYSVYPVPLIAEDGYWWVGESLEYRVSLLRYIIKRLKDTIRRAEKNGKASII